MKRLLSTFALFAIMVSAYAQTSNVIVFTENGEKFYVILNGLRQNDKPETNVKLTELNADFYKMKIIFDDKRLGEKMFNLGFNQGMETTMVIKKNSKGEYVLRPVSETAMAQAPPSTPGQTVVTYNDNAPGTVTQTTTYSTTGATGDNVNVSIGMNMSENGGGINMNVSGIDGSQTQTTTHTTTTTVTHTTTTHDPVAPPPPPPNLLPGYNGPIGCPVPMSPGDFSDLKNTISSKTFEDSKMTIAKQVLQNNCLLTTQVKDLMGLFTFEATKLDFAKYAYDYTYDVGNYYKVNDQFTFESSIDELNQYISGRK